MNKMKNVQLNNYCPKNISEYNWTFFQDLPKLPKNWHCWWQVFLRFASQMDKNLINYIKGPSKCDIGNSLHYHSNVQYTSYL